MTDILEHHGIKGMKWGVTKDEPGGSSRPSTAEIKSARSSRQVKRATIVVAKDNLSKAKQDYNNKAEKKTARTFTKGEKVAVGVGVAAGAVAAGYLLHKYGNISLGNVAKTVTSHEEAFANAREHLVEAHKNETARVLSVARSESKRVADAARSTAARTNDILLAEQKRAAEINKVVGRQDTLLDAYLSKPTATWEDMMNVPLSSIYNK